MGEFSMDRLAPSSRIAEPKAQQNQRDSIRPARGKPRRHDSAEQRDANTPDPESPPHHVDRLA
jgi:hypothetical protein